MKTNLILITLILLFSILVSLPLLKRGLYEMHDDQQVARLYLMDKSLKEGQFPVRWVDKLGFGFGYPLFNFYPPFIYLLAELFHLGGFGFIDSLKIVIFISIFLSGISIYVLSRELFGEWEGIIAAIFYMYVPYRAIDVYIRGALSESFSFVWLPLILWSFYKLHNTQRPVFIYLSSIFLALLMITHNLTFLQFILLLPFYLIYLTLQSKNRKKFIVYSLLSIVYSFLLSAFFWLPSVLEKSYTLVDKIYLATNYRDHFVYSQQLWDWQWGFGGSAPGLADGISFKIGKLHILSSLVALILAITCLSRSRKSPKLSVVSCQLSVVLFLLFLFSAFMTTFYSKFIWDTITPLAYLQFPWRFLIFTALFTSILASAFTQFLKTPILKLVLGVILIVLLIYSNTKLFKPQTYRTYLTDEIATNESRIKWETSLQSFDYAPSGVKIIDNEFGNKQIDIEKTKIPQDKITIENGNVSYNLIEQKSHKLEFQLMAETSSTIGANIFNFPGWIVKVDGKSTAINDDNPLKLISFEVPAGVHKVIVEFSNTSIRNIANLISVVSIIVLMYLFFRSWHFPTKN